MSIDLNWEALTTGADGDALAEQIRDFIHSRFQSMTLPRFIKSVTVHEFAFGTIPPELELKDVTDPLPDFYDEIPDADDVDSDADGEGDYASSSGGDDDGDDYAHGEGLASSTATLLSRGHRRDGGLHQGRESTLAQEQRHAATGHPPRINTASPFGVTSPFVGVSTPGIGPGASGASHYFSHFAAAGGWSGNQTPLAAVAGGPAAWPDPEAMYQERGSRGVPPTTSRDRGGGLQERREQQTQGQQQRWHGGHSRNASYSSSSIGLSDDEARPSRPAGGALGANDGSFAGLLREKHSVSTLAPTSVGTSRPPTRDPTSLSAAAGWNGEDADDGGSAGTRRRRRRRRREPQIEDLQAVFRIRYAGDVMLRLTAELLLDYPMPSFVGIPVKLKIVGLVFDGIGVLAKVRRRVHFCFLSPEDAVAAVGAEVSGEGAADGAGAGSANAGLGGLLREIRVESEIGEREGGKQSLKNVGKVERFVLDQVRRIFEEEFVYPSFWTFLV